MIVTTQDCQTLGYCLKAVKPWMGQNGIDFRDFVRHGVPIERIEAIDDVLAQRACAACRERYAKESG